jgi:hypothetical protein
MNEPHGRAPSAFAENRGETFADRARAARSQERAEIEARRSAEINEILSRPCDGINEVTAATFRGAQSQVYAVAKRKRSKTGADKTLREGYSRIFRGGAK